MSVTQERSAARRPWAPPGVPDDMIEDRRLRYLVVDDIIGNVVTLAVSSWPASDPLGRVRFTSRRAVGHLLVHERELHAQLYDKWLHRRPRAGDALATVLDPTVDRLLAGGDVVLDSSRRLHQAMPHPVVDLTAEARNVAKLGFFAAVAGVQKHETAVALRQVKKNGGRPARAPKPSIGTVQAGPWEQPVLPGPAVRASDAKPPRWAVPDEHWPAPEQLDLVAALKDHPEALFYFLLNIGDGDTQLLLLPKVPDDAEGYRRAVVVDAGTSRKLSRLMADLATPEVGALPPRGHGHQTCALVVATHPHDDHIGGLPDLLRTYGRTGIDDFWEPGFYAPTESFAELMAAVEDLRIPHCEPTAGMVRYVDGVKITVLGPAVQLRNAYDTYGVDCNNASIVLKVQFPAARISTRTDGGHARREDVRLPDPWSIILGADAQTTSWAHVTTDFEELHRGHDRDHYRSMRKAVGRDHLGADILKVSHHASKHGINIELVERMQPNLSLISSVGGGGQHGFPHALATESIAEALAPRASAGTPPPDGVGHDAALGIHYTGGVTADNRKLGSIALMVPARAGGSARNKLKMWRFGDDTKEPVDLAKGRLLAPIYTST